MGKFKIPAGVMAFVAIWVAALCVPTVREIPKTFAFYELFLSDGAFSPGSTARDLARRYPTNSTAASWGAQDRWWRGDVSDDEDSDAAISVRGGRGALEKVVARFPDDLQARALQVRMLAQGLNDLKRVRAEKDAGQRAQWIEAARDGGQLEPDNAFWPWMEAGFEFAARRDDAALAALARAGKCARYQDYALATTYARVRLWESVATPAWEQKVALWASTLFPHLAVMRASGALAAQRATDLRAAGQIGRALAIESDVLVASSLCRRDGDTLITALVAEATAKESLEQFLGIAKPKESATFYVDPAIHTGDLVRAWSDLARGNGQSELATRADFLRESSVRGLLRGIEDPSLELFGMRAPWGTVAAISPQVLLLLGVSILAGAALWMAGAPLKFEGREPTRGQVAMCANFSFWLLAVGVAALVASIKMPSGFIYGGDNWSPWLIGVGFWTAAALVWLLPVWFVGLKVVYQLARFRPRNPRPLSLSWNRARKASWLLFGLGLLLTLSNGRGLWDGTWFQLANAALVADVALFSALVLEFARWLLAGWRFRLNKRASATSAAVVTGGLKRWAPFGLWLSCGVFLAYPAMNLVQQVPFFESIPLLTLAGLAAIGALISGWRASPDRFKWRLARSSAGALVLAWSVAFLLMALASWPLRAELNRNLEQRLKVGEIAWMREQGAKAK